MTDYFDTIVVGAGVMGSAAAYHLAKDGQRTLLIERFEVAHTRGSSNGESRIFRFAYNNPDYARLAMQSLPHWRALEADSGERLLEVIGGLDLTHDPAHHADVDAVADALSQVGARFEQLDAAQIKARYPQWRLGDEAIAVFSPDSGFLRATRCVQVMVEQAAKRGATVREREPVTKIVPGRPVEVITAAARYRADRLIITGGAWINELIQHVGLQLPVQIEQEQFPPEVEQRYIAYIKEYLAPRYAEFIEKELQTAYLESYSEYGQNIFDRYVTYADMWIQDQEYRDPDTGEILDRAQLNAELEKIEKPAGIANPKDFRHEVVNFVLRARAQNHGKNPAWTSYEKLRTVIEKRMFSNTEDLLPVISFNAKASSEEQKKHQEFVQRMVAKGYTEKQVRLLAEWYLRARKAS
jgi:monomeric sarcosine oxidase